MLWWALVFFIVAIIAALFGFTNIAGGAMSIARILLIVFVILFIISVVMHFVRGGG
ncbi:MAG: hypothetical protein S4CHLAM2_07380 [Chlamydiales bacterium]|nr:hypothetical protein [Chlamydiales bacterium]